MPTKKISNEKTKVLDPKEYKIPKGETWVLNEAAIAYGPLNPDAGKQYTYADYLTWLDEKRRELINGILHLMSAPNEFHARITSRWNILVGMYLNKHKGKCRIYHAPFDVRLPIHGEKDENKIVNIVQPDICVVCDLSKIDARGCLGAPDLIVEVLSPSSMKYDLTEKFNLYETAGVKEYWVVAPKLNSVNVFLLQKDGKYDDGTIYEYGDKVPVHIIKGMEIDLTELFED